MIPKTVNKNLFFRRPIIRTEQLSHKALLVSRTGLCLDTFKSTCPRKNGSPAPSVSAFEVPDMKKKT